MDPFLDLKIIYFFFYNIGFDSLIGIESGEISKFLRKHRFNILMFFLVLVFIVVSFYMLWVHIPYASYKNDLIKVEQEIVAENGYESSDYFNRYDGEKVVLYNTW